MDYHKNRKSVRELTESVRQWLANGRAMTAREMVENHMQHEYEDVGPDYAKYLARRLAVLEKHGVVRSYYRRKGGWTVAKVWRLRKCQ